MRAIIQRVANASVTIDGVEKAAIGTGLLVLLGITLDDSREDVSWLCQKIAQMRIFNDADGKMNLALADVEGEVLLISQFTLHASTRKGNRPSFISAARPEQAIPLYEGCIKELERLLGKPIGTGSFGADMKVSLLNDGPVTIVIDSKQKE